MTKSGTTPKDTPTIQPTRGGSFVRDKASGAITQVDGPKVSVANAEPPKPINSQPQDTVATDSTTKPKEEASK